MTVPYFKTPNDGKHYFFGYYDKSPLDLTNTKLLALQVDFIDRLPTEKDTARIGYFDLSKKDNIFYELERTRVFNWQQGCMLQWHGDRDGQIIYNDLINNKFVSIIYNIHTGEKTVLQMAIYALSHDSKFALCIDNERHYWVRRGYSYDGIHNPDKNKNVVNNDGIYLLDIENDKVEQIINIQAMINNLPLSNMHNSVHYLEHVMINPDDSRFAFLHRWKTEGGGIYTRLYTANIDGSQLYLLNDSGRMSHFCWGWGGHLFGWGGISNSINRLRKYKNFAKFFIKPMMPLYKRLISGNAIDGNSKISSMVTGDSYILFKDKTTTKQKILNGILNRDGHPSYCPSNKNLIVTDTYPDKNGVAQLIIFNIKNKERYVVDKLNSIQNYDNSPNRCDLHPKWSFDGKFVSVDTMNDGVRGIYVYKIH
jgi:hypothetical protein